MLTSQWVIQQCVMSAKSSLKWKALTGLCSATNCKSSDCSSITLSRCLPGNQNPHLSMHLQTNRSAVLISQMAQIWTLYMSFNTYFSIHSVLVKKIAKAEIIQVVLSLRLQSQMQLSVESTSLELCQHRQLNLSVFSSGSNW